MRYARQLGVDATGWDPVHANDVPLRRASIVNLGYVINVIEDRSERADALRSAWKLAADVLIVSARLDWETSASEGKPFQDGILTTKGTFQKYFSQDKLRAWIDTSLGERCVAAAPGIFYVFRSSAAEQRLLARHSRRHNRPKLSVAELVYRQQEDLLDPLAQWIAGHWRLPTAADIDNAAELIETFGSIRAAFSLIKRVTGPAGWSEVDLGARLRSEERFEANLDILEPLIDFLTDRGRLPRDDELPQVADLKEEFGSIRGAFSLIRRVAGAERWDGCETRARQDFLVYLALAAFGGRPKFSDLPADLQYDTRDFFGTYKDACVQADRLLYGVGNLEAINLACRSASYGKLTPEALYVHTVGVSELPELLRVYIGCAEALTGTVENATLLKLHREKPQVSFLIYPEFDNDPHPVLMASIVARLRELRVTYKDFVGRENPPVLHRKEAFVPPDYPSREKFVRLTRQEERNGLLDSPTIGTARGWQEALVARGLVQQGHRLVRRSQLVP